MFRLRSKDKRPPPPDPLTVALADLASRARATQAKVYGQGFLDGVEEATLQLLGRSKLSPEGGAPQEHVTPEVRKWAEAVLARTKEES